MSTPAQILANWQNSESSTGPRTEEGKAASSQNAVKHGATAQTVVLAWEDRREFDSLRNSHLARFRPVDHVEFMLVEEIVSAEWRMRRMELLIAYHIDREAYLHRSTVPLAALSDVMLSPEVAKLQRYENTFRRAFESAWKKLDALQKQRKTAEKENEAKIQGEARAAARAAARKTDSETPSTAPEVRSESVTSHQRE
jgi:hypothetical protein